MWDLQHRFKNVQREFDWELLQKIYKETNNRNKLKEITFERKTKNKLTLKEEIRSKLYFPNLLLISS